MTTAEDSYWTNRQQTTTYG